MGNCISTADDFEKVNVYVPGEVYDMLERDIEMFEIYKKDGRSLNRSHFRNKLIQGYHDSYVEETKRTHSGILSFLKETSLTEKERHEIAERLAEEVSYRGGKRGGKGSRPISIKPAGRTKDIMCLIPSSEAPSQYFRRMIISYCSKSFSQREQIVFKDVFTRLCEYCKEQQPVYISTIWNPSKMHEVLPVRMAIGVEEMYNYLLCQEVNPDTQRPEARSYVLHRISSLNVSPMKAGLDSGVKRHLQEMVKKGPQFAINEDEEVCVRLTGKGQNYYSRIYFGKPRYTKIVECEDGYYHYYHCSMDQVFFYFRRFDPSTVEIIAPISLREKMKQFYSDGMAMYMN